MSPLPSPGRAACALFLLAAIVFPPRHSAADPSASPAAKADQVRRLEERDRLREEARRHLASDRVRPAGEAAEKALTITREVRGNAHDEMVDALQLVADVQEARDDFPAARKLREKALALQTRLRGKEHWKTTSARLELAHTKHIATLSASQRRRLASA